jgi:hypothetical protein
MEPKLLLLFLAFTQIIFAQNFTQVSGTPFAGVAQSSIAFADVDDDKDLDVLITGLNFSQQNLPGVRTSKLYTNDGSGNYTEVLGTPFAGVEEGSIAFADVDGDNDQDVLITGSFTAKLYTNDGAGTFTEVTGTPFQGVNESSIAFADVDGDNDQDVLITGYQVSSPVYISTARLYLNDGSGSFTEMMNTPFTGVRDAALAFADVDGDNDQDVLITGSSSGAFGNTKLYTNDGSGGFTVVMGTSFDQVADGALAFADVDGDNDLDVLITGTDGTTGISKLYTNNGSGNFTEVMGTPFPGLQGSALAFADVDGDNDQDVLLTGGTGIFSFPYTRLFTNDGSGNFTEVTAPPFTDLTNGSLAFADVDGDNDQDVLITGQDLGTTYNAQLYLNDGLASSSEDRFVDASLDLTPFPNPATSNNLQVRFNSTGSNTVTIRVYDLKGRLISEQQEFAGTGEQTLVVDIATLPAGSYFLQLENGKESGIAKFMVQ